MDNARDKLEMYKEETKRNAEIEKINDEIRSRKQKIVDLRRDIGLKKERIERNKKELRKAEEDYKNERKFLTRLKKRGNNKDYKKSAWNLWLFN